MPVAMISVRVDRHNEEAQTNERGAIAIGKLIAHELLRVNASILIARSRGRQDGLVHLKVDKRAGS